jgi:hypothetical protein
MGCLRVTPSVFSRARWWGYPPELMAHMQETGAGMVFANEPYGRSPGPARRVCGYRIQNDYFPGGKMELAGSVLAAAESARLLATFRNRAVRSTTSVTSPPAPAQPSSSTILREPRSTPT